MMMTIAMSATIITIIIMAAVLERPSRGYSIVPVMAGGNTS
jgi:hypothetical protein